MLTIYLHDLHVHMHMHVQIHVFLCMMYLRYFLVCVHLKILLALPVQ